MVELINFSDPSIKGSNVKIVKINLAEDYISKLDQIGFYEDQILYVEKDNLKNIIQFRINNVKYAIRINDAKNIIVKKESNDACLFV